MHFYLDTNQIGICLPFSCCGLVESGLAEASLVVDFFPLARDMACAFLLLWRPVAGLVIVRQVQEERPRMRT